MRILAVDTSSNAAAAAVIEDGLLTGEYILNHKKTHSQKIMVMIERLMDDLELEVSDIDVFAAAKGPGSFTGLRIGIATVKALAHSVNKPVVGVDTLEGLAYNLVSEKTIAVVMDARRGFVFNAAYKRENGVFKCVKEPNVCNIKECALNFKDTDVIFTGDGVNSYENDIKEALGKSVEFAPPQLRMTHASSVAYAAYNMAKNGKTMHYSELAPQYLRLSQAEQELLKKQNSKEEK